MNRLYPQEFPELGEYVVGQITDADEKTIYCHLLDYDLDGLMSYKEYKRTYRRKGGITNPKTEVHVGKKEVVLCVTGVEPEHGYVDLSKKDVSRENQELALGAFHDAKTIHQFFKRWSELTGSSLVEDFLWPLYDDHENVLTAFKNNEIDRDLLVDNIDKPLVEKFSKELDKLVEVKPQNYEETFEMCCTSPEGIDAIKEAIRAGLDHSTEEHPLKITYTGKNGSNGSIYIVSTIDTPDCSELKVINAALTSIEETLNKYTGTFARRNRA